MRRRGAIVLSLLVPVLVACDGQAPAEETAPQPTPTATSQSMTDPPVAPVMETRLPADLADVPVADIGLPARMPTASESLPSLLDDPPGRAVMSYRPVESFDDPQGWSGEAFYVLGTDGGWRRLAMADLDLPEDWWPGHDMYGAGQVSPDGRWWAAYAGPNVLLMNLRTSEHRLVDLGTDRSVRFVRWLPDSRALQAFSNRASEAHGVSSTHLVRVSGNVRVSPYGPLAVAFEPDGTAVKFTAHHRLRWADPATTPTKDAVPGWWHLQGDSWRSHHGERLSILPIFRETAEVEDLLAVDRATLEPAARLVNRRGGFVGPGESMGISYGWLDDETLLTSTSSWLVTWAPAEGELRRVVRMPRVPPYVWAGWSASFALDLLGPHRLAR